MSVVFSNVTSESINIDCNTECIECVNFIKIVNKVQFYDVINIGYCYIIEKENNTVGIWKIKELKKL